MKKMTGSIGAAVLVLALGAQVQAVELRIGGSANLGTSNDFGVGPRLELDLGDYVPGLRFAGDFHKFFDSDVYSDVDGLKVESNAWDAGIHVLYDFATVDIAEGATLYAGAGLLYAKRNYDHWLEPATGEITDGELRNRYGKLQKLEEQYKNGSGAGLALTVGGSFKTGWTVTPFVEARFTTGTVNELMLAAGLLFATGSGTTK